MSENQQNQDRNEGGLFSDEYQAPKRENPYLKKNREKAKEKEKSQPEKPARKPAAPVSDAEPREGYTRKRTFSDWMFEHVKIIAAIATVLVVLSLVLITDVVSVVGDLITQTQQAGKEELPLTYVQGLAEKTAPISWGDLDKFRRDESEANDTITWMIPVKGSHYEVWISGVSISKRPSYVYLFDMKTGDRMVLGVDDFEAFIESHS